MLGISMPTMTFGLLLHDGICVDAPPIARWCVGKKEDYLIRYWRNRDAQLRWID